MVTLGAYISHRITQLALLSTSTTIISEASIKVASLIKYERQGAMHAQTTVFEVMGPIQLGGRWFEDEDRIDQEGHGCGLHGLLGATSSTKPCS